MHCIEAKTGIYTRIEDAKRGSAFLCLVCSEPAFVREGDRNTKHFSHSPGSPCVAQKGAGGGEARETYEQCKARLILKNVVETDRVLYLSSVCQGTHCPKVETTLYVHEAPLSIHPGAGIHIYTHSILQNYKPEGELFFSCEPDWKCEECELYEANQAKKFEENRIQALKEANIRQNTFDFGKYINKTFDWVMEVDPAYFKFVLRMEATGQTVLFAQDRMRIFLSQWIKKQRG
jgi:hypothetical protein